VQHAGAAAVAHFAVRAVAVGNKGIAALPRTVILNWLVAAITGRSWPQNCATSYQQRLFMQIFH
jgi:hypothetical protein